MSEEPITAQPVEAADKPRCLVYVRNGALATDSMTISREFGRRHDNVLRTLDGLIADGTLNRLNFEAVEYRDAKGEARRMVELDERGALIAMPFFGGRRAKQGQAKLVDAFLGMRDQLHAMQASPVAAPAPKPQAATLTGDIALCEAYARLLNVSPSGRLALLHQVADIHGLDSRLLPSYAIDAPTGSKIDSSAATASLSSLLKDRGLKIGAARFFKVLESAGIVVRHKRATTQKKRFPGGIKEFWALTEAGTAFGKNVTDPRAQREVAPHFFRDRFDQLRAIARPHYAHLHESGVL